MVHGSCLCGGVRFTISGALEKVQICHCGQCRKAQGAPFATNIPVRESALAFESGLDLLSDYESSPGKHRCFCRRCGSPVLSRRDALPGIVRIRAGLLDEPVPATLQAHYHVESKCGWWPITDDLPQFEESAPRPKG